MLSSATVPSLLQIAGLVHGFEERPPVGETREEGRTRVIESVRSRGRVLFLRQVHGARIVEAPWDLPPEADGGLSDRRGVLLGIETADCLPVFLVDPVGRRLAAIHAGWRGTAQQIVKEGVEALVAQGSRRGDLMAALGPAIGACCYEVGEEVREAIALPECFEERASGRPHFDLRRANRLQLLASGVTQIEEVRECTFCSREKYHSFRRDGKGGRMVNFVGWTT
jgi:YfiH family protein